MLSKCDKNFIANMLNETALDDECTISRVTKGEPTDFGYEDITTSKRSKCKIVKYASPKEIILGAKIKSFYDATVLLPLTTQVSESDTIESKSIKYEIIGIDRGKTNPFLLECAVRKVDT